MWFVTIGVLLAETTFYLIFASGEVQKWNNVHDDGNLNTSDDLMENQYHEKQMDTKKKAV